MLLLLTLYEKQYLEVDTASFNKYDFCLLSEFASNDAKESIRFLNF